MNTDQTVQMDAEPAAADSTSSDKYCIYHILRNQKKKPKPLPLNGDKITIGRSSDADLLLASNSISRTHAILSLNASVWSIQDSKKSTNGVFVNENRLKPFRNYTLHDGDVFSLGPPNDTDFSFQFCRFGEDPEGSPAMVPPCKIAKAEENEVTPKKSEEDDLRNKLLELKQQLRDKEDNEKTLREQLVQQEKYHQETIERERDRIMKEKQEAEDRLKENLASELLTQEQHLRAMLSTQQNALINEKKNIEEIMRQKLQDRDKEMDEKLQLEQQRLAKELAESALKASYLESQLRESMHLQDQAKAQMLSQFGDLMETEMTCSICSELFIQAVTLGCSHTFCLLCIGQWKAKKRDCPICRARIKNETRALVIDNFIERMVDSLPIQMKTSRQELIACRLNPPPPKDPRFATGIWPRNLSRGAPIPNPRYPHVLQSAPPAVRNPTVLINRLQSNVQPPAASNYPGVYYARTAINVPTTSVTNVVYPNTTMRVVLPQLNVATAIRQPGGGYQSVLVNQPASVSVTTTTASNPANMYRMASSVVMVSQPSVIQQQAATPVYRVENPALQASTSNLVHTTRNNMPGVGRGAALNHAITQHFTRGNMTINNSAASGSQNSSSVGSTTLTTVASTSQASQLSQASSTTDRQNAIVISDSEEETDSHSESSQEGMSDAYYGGYGRCYSCGRRGHWSNGCPDRY